PRDRSQDSFLANRGRHPSLGGDTHPPRVSYSSSLRGGARTLFAGGRTRGNPQSNAPSPLVGAGPPALLRVWTLSRGGPDRGNARSSGVCEVQIEASDRARVGRMDRSRRVCEAREETGPYGRGTKVAHASETSRSEERRVGQEGITKSGG